MSDYKLNIFDYHEYKDFGQFHTELQSVFEFLRYSTDKKMLAEKLEKHKESYGALSSQAKILLIRLANIKKIPNVTGEKFGLSEKKILEKLQNKLNISEKKARKYFSIFAEQAV